jgi:uncharacterized protein YecE (DUF72 family)
MLAEARVGTSGFAYREWIGQVYPPEATLDELLPMYAQRLSGVELASLPSGVASEWAAMVPPGFQFALKAPGRVAADFASGKGVSRAMGTFLEAAVGLGAALGPVLIQVPESRRADRRVLASFLAELPQGLRVAFEFKHPSWREDATLRLLSAHEAGLVLTDEGGGAPPLELTAGFTYVRIRGDDDREDALDAWAERLGGLARRGVDVYAFLQHDRRGLAVDRAMRLATLLRAESGVGEQAMLS